MTAVAMASASTSNSGTISAPAPEEQVQKLWCHRILRAPAMEQPIQRLRQKGRAAAIQAYRPPPPFNLKRLLL